MNLERVLKRLQTASSNDDLRTVARELGDELPRNRLEILREFRAGTSLGRDDAATWSAGYRSALDDLVAAYDDAVTSAREDDQLLVVASDRWADILEAISAGPKTQKELADGLQLDPARVSRLLAEIRHAELAEVVRSADDARARPHRLTSRGFAVVEKVRARRTSLPTLAKVLVELTASTLGRVLIDGIAPTELVVADAAAKLSGISVDARVAVDLIAAECERLSLLTTEDGTLMSRDFSVPRMVSVVLDRSLAEKTKPAFWDELAVCAPPDVACLVRPSWMTAGSWKNVLLQRDENGNTPQWLGAGSKTLEQMDVREGLATVPSGKFAIVYDQPSLLERESKLDGVRRLLDRAESVVCFSERDEEFSDRVKSLRIEPFVQQKAA